MGILLRDGTFKYVGGKIDEERCFRNISDQRQFQKIEPLTEKKVNIFLRLYPENGIDETSSIFSELTKVCDIGSR